MTPASQSHAHRKPLPPGNGVWHLRVAAPGQYQFELRRWPEEADLPLSAPAPETTVADGVYVAGKALPIRCARLRVGDRQQSQEVSPADKTAVFQVSLQEGPTTLQAWFCDGDGNEICGAYYVKASRLDPP